MIDFVNYVNDVANSKRGQNIMLPIGCDFAYQNASAEYRQLELLIDYVNKHNTANITLVMSTPSQWLEAVKKENVSWPVKYDDIFPYSDAENDYWTGYFTSRPSAKKQVRDVSALMNAQSKLYAQRVIRYNASESDLQRIIENKRQMLEQLSIYLHHDAITGTAKQYVADDYTERISRAIDFSSLTYK